MPRSELEKVKEREKGGIGAMPDWTFYSERERTPGSIPPILNKRIKRLTDKEPIPRLSMSHSSGNSQKRNRRAIDE